MTVPPPPLIPAAAETVVAMGLFLAFAIAYGLLTVYRSTLQRILIGLASAIEDVGIPTGIRRIHPFGPLADGLRWVDAEIDDGLALAVQSTQRGGTILFQLVKRQLTSIGDQVGGLAYDVSERFHHTDRVTIPRIAGIAVKPVRISLDKTRTLAHATAGTIAHDLPGLRHRVKEGERVLDRLGKRVKGIEKLLAPAAFAALVAAVFRKWGLSVLRCPKFLKAARNTCGMDPQLLESLLLDTTLVLSALSLRTFAHEMQSVTDEVGNGIRHLIAESRKDDAAK